MRVHSCIMHPTIRASLETNRLWKHLADASDAAVLVFIEVRKLATDARVGVYSPLEYASRGRREIEWSNRNRPCRRKKGVDYRLMDSRDSEARADLERLQWSSKEY